MSTPVWDLPRPVHLADFLADARRGGCTFDDAWGRAMAVVLRAALEHDAWLEVFQATREMWRRAYEGEPPTRAEMALRGLVVGEVTDLDGVGLDLRRCAHCGKPLPSGMKPTALYCDRGCKRGGAYEREQRIARHRTPAGDGSQSRGPTMADCLGSPRQLEAA